MNEIWWAHIWEGIFSRGADNRIIGILPYVLSSRFQLSVKSSSCLLIVDKSKRL